MKQISDPNALKTMANEVLDANPQSIEDYANGKKIVCRILSRTGYEEV